MEKNGRRECINQTGSVNGDGPVITAGIKAANSHWGADFMVVLVLVVILHYIHSSVVAAFAFSDTISVGGEVRSGWEHVLLDCFRFRWEILIAHSQQTQRAMS